MKGGNTTKDKKSNNRRQEPDDDEEVSDCENDEQRDKEECMICCNNIDYYGVAFPCGHNQCCWNCLLKQKLKLANDACSYCNQTVTKVLISK